MTPKKINKLLDKMLKIADGDVVDTYRAWRITQGLYHFFSEADAGVYYNDPMSQSAPFECFDLHMKRWKPLNDRLKSPECIRAEEMYRRMVESLDSMYEFEQQNPEIEGVPF
jgi:hypothetical protein